MRIINRTEECAAIAGRESQDMQRWLVRYLVIHRISLARYDFEQNPEPIKDEDLHSLWLARAFRNRALLTGGQVPYHILIRKNGDIEQALPLLKKGAHCVGYNWQSWGVAVAGDFRGQEPTQDQIDSLDWILARMPNVNAGLKIRAHDRMSGGSLDSTKVCPGPLLDLDAACERTMHARIPWSVDQDPWVRLQRCGFVLQTGQK